MVYAKSVRLSGKLCAKNIVKQFTLRISYFDLTGQLTEQLQLDDFFLLHIYILLFYYYYYYY